MAQTITISAVGDAITVANTASESVTFERPTNQLTINADTDTDIINVGDLGNYDGTLTIKTLGGDDTVNLQSITSAVTYDIDTGSTGETSGDTITASVSGSADVILANARCIGGGRARPI